MRVQDVMREAVAVCGPKTNAAEAAELMWVNNCGCLPVVEEDGKVVGVVTDRDLFIALGTQNRLPSELTMDQAVEGGAVCGPEDEIEDAMEAMKAGGFRHLPVVDDEGRLQGVIFRDDLALERPVARMAGAAW